VADFVLDTSALINSWLFHYRLPVFEGVWDAVGDGMDGGTLIAPSEVLVEIDRKAGDDLHAWAVTHNTAFCPPEPTWSAHFGTLEAYAPHWFTGTGKHEADPFVVAMALVEGLPVVTYEGRAFSGEPARVRTQNRGMPHVCASVGVEVATMVDVLDHLGVVLS
jgi:hypothetical protein